VGIDDRIRDAHLSHYCPGGLGVPVTSSGPVGLTVDLPAGPEAESEADSNRLRADGETCRRCGKLLAPGQDARRRLDGQLVHETCPSAKAQQVSGEPI
jgi:hypothetical protein